MLLVVEEILLLGIKGPADRCLVRAQGTSLPPPRERLMQPTAWRRGQVPAARTTTTSVLPALD
jgi:hypothetical protein